MRIEKLELNNFRGFEHLEIEFPKEEAGLAVLIGVNGSGKSSVLEAIVTFFEEGLSGEDFEEGASYVNTHDIRKGANKLKNSILFNFLDLLKIDAKYSVGLGERKLIERELNIPNFKVEIVTRCKDNPDFNAPILLYFDSKRKLNPAEIGKSYSDQIFALKQLQAIEQALNAGANFNNFQHWFLKKENSENREKIAQKDFDYQDANLRVIRKAINSFFVDEKLRDIHIVSEDSNQNSIWATKSSFLAIKKNEEELKLNQLSDGEKIMLFLVADISHRLVQANPSLENPLNGEGLILIDEIDLHLHPAWQRKIIPNLRKTFPNIQFIVTTHSPQVLSSVKRENVFILEDFKVVKNTPHTLGRDSNSILADVFSVGSRPEFSKQEFEELYKLIDDPKKEKEAKEMLEKMTEKYGVEDSEIVQAGLHLEFLTD